jgi:hypothetical protein
MCHVSSVCSLVSLNFFFEVYIGLIVLLSLVYSKREFILRAALTLFFVLLVSQAWGKNLTTNLGAFECGAGKDRVPIILKRNESSWETVTTFGDQANEVLSPDANTHFFLRLILSNSF